MCSRPGNSLWAGTFRAVHWGSGSITPNRTTPPHGHDSSGAIPDWRSSCFSPHPFPRRREMVDYAGPRSSRSSGRRCYACHGALKQKAGLRLDTAAAHPQGRRQRAGGRARQGRREPAHRRRHRATAGRGCRPRTRAQPLTAGQVALLRAWIDQGRPVAGRSEPAPKTRASTGRSAARPAARAARRPTRAWVRNPIDAFLAAEHERRGLQPRPAGRPRDPAPPRLPRPDRPAADARGAARLPRRPVRRRLREGRRPAAGQPAVRRALGAGTGWTSGATATGTAGAPCPTCCNSYAADLALARLDRPLAERGQGLRPDGREMLAADEIAPADDANRRRHRLPRPQLVPLELQPRG